MRLLGYVGLLLGEELDAAGYCDWLFLGGVVFLVNIQLIRVYFRFPLDMGDRGGRTYLYPDTIG